MAYIAFTDWSGTMGHHGVYIYDVDPIEDTFLAGTCDTYQYWMEPIAYKDGYCYLGGYYGWGTKTIDVDPPASAHEVDTDDTSLSHGARYGFCVYGDYLYEASQWDGLMIYDISNPANPQFQSMTGPPYPSEPSNWSFGVDVDPDTEYAYLVTGHTSLTKVLTVIDVSNKSNPTIVKTIILPSQPRDIAVRGDYAYVLCSGRLVVVDISDPENAFIETSLSIGSFWNMHLVIEGNYVYIAFGDFSNGRLYIIDISDPTNPTLFDTFTGLPNLTRGIDIYCGIAYIGARDKFVIVELY
jgi:hypothetical protein